MNSEVQRPPTRLYEVRTVHSEAYWAEGDVIESGDGWLTLWADQFTIAIRVPEADVRAIRQVSEDELYAGTLACCTVEQCTTTGTLANPGGNWSRDAQGRHFCPAHPAATSCRICGRDKGTNRYICGPCARDNSKEQQA